MNCISFNGAITRSISDAARVMIGCNGINDICIIGYCSVRDDTCIILVPHVAGACGVGACVIVLWSSSDVLVVVMVISNWIYILDYGYLLGLCLDHVHYLV